MLQIFRMNLLCIQLKSTERRNSYSKSFSLSFGGRRSAPVAGGKCGDSVISCAAKKECQDTLRRNSATTENQRILKDTERYWRILDGRVPKSSSETHTLWDTTRGLIFLEMPALAGETLAWHSAMSLQALAHLVYFKTPQGRVLAVVQVIPRHRLVCDLAICDAPISETKVVRFSSLEHVFSWPYEFFVCSRAELHHTASVASWAKDSLPEETFFLQFWIIVQFQVLTRDASLNGLDNWMMAWMMVWPSNIYHPMHVCTLLFYIMCMCCIYLLFYE